MAQKKRLDNLATAAYQQAVKNFLAANQTPQANPIQQKLAEARNRAMQQTAAPQKHAAVTLPQGPARVPGWNETYANLVKKLMSDGQVSALTNKRTNQPTGVAPYLQQASDLFAAQGGPAKNPTYDELVQRYWSMAPTANEQAKVQALGGYANLTEEQLNQMRDESNYKPTEDVRAWDMAFNPAVKQAMKSALVNQQMDLQQAQASGANDRPENLWNGNIDMVSDDYLAMLEAQLPGMMQDETKRYDEAVAAYPGQLQDYERAFGEYAIAQGASPEAAIRMKEAYDAVKQGVGWDALNILEQGDVEQLVAFDNLITGKNRDASYLGQYADETEAEDEISRLMEQYGRAVIDGQASEYGPKAPKRYPYEKVLELVQGEREARAAMTPYLQVIAQDPEFLDKSMFQLRYPADVWNEEGLDVQVAFGYLYEDERGHLVSNKKNLLNNYDTDMIEYLIINGEIDTEGYKNSPVITKYQNKGYEMMTEPEKAVYNYYYNTGDLQTARAYLKQMEPALEKRWKSIRDAVWEEYATDNWFTGALMFGAKGVAGTAAGLAAPIQLGMRYAGVDNPSMNAFADYRNVTSEAQLNALADQDWLGVELFGQNIPQWAYNTLSTMQDMNSARAAAGLLGNLNYTLPLMGLQTVSHDLSETEGSGMSDEERVVHAIGAGLMEGLTEKLPFDMLNKMPGSLGYLLGAAMSESGEESVNKSAGYAWDDATAAMFGRKTPTQEELDILEMSGIENPGQTVLQERLRGVASAAFGGMLGGLGMGAQQTVANSAQNANVGSQVKKSGNADQLVQLGAAMKEGSESRKLAEALQKRKSRGSANLGQLYRALMADTTAEYHEVIRDQATRAVADEIATKQNQQGGPTDTRYTTEELAKGIIAMADGQKISKGLQRYIETHRSTMETYREFADESKSAAWAKQLMQDRMATAVKYTKQQQQLAGMTAAQGSPQQNTAQQPAAQAEKSTSAQEIRQETDAEYKRLVGKNAGDMLSRKVNYDDGSGNEATAEILRVERSGKQLNVLINENGTEKAIAYDALTGAESGGVARILAYAEQHLETESPEINAMLEALKDGGEATEIIAAVEEGVLAGYYGTAPQQAAQGIQQAVQSQAGNVQGAANQAAQQATTAAAGAAQQAVEKKTAETEEQARKTVAEKLQQRWVSQAEQGLNAMTESQATDAEALRAALENAVEVAGEILTRARMQGSMDQSMIDQLLEATNAFKASELLPADNQGLINAAWQMYNDVGYAIAKYGQAGIDAQMEAAQEGGVEEFGADVTEQAQVSQEQAQQAEEELKALLAEHWGKMIDEASADLAKTNERGAALVKEIASGAEAMASKAMVQKHLGQVDQATVEADMSRIAEWTAKNLDVLGFSVPAAKLAYEIRMDLQNLAERMAQQMPMRRLVATPIQDANGSIMQSARSKAKKAAKAAAANAAQTGSMQTVAAGMTQEAREKLVEQGRKIGEQLAQESETLRVQDIGKSAAGKGTVSYMGTVANSRDIGDTGVRQAMKGVMNRLTVQQHAQVQAIEQLAKVLPVDIVFYESAQGLAKGEAIEAPNGWIDAATNTIFLDLNAGMTEGGETLVESAIIKTAGHELTHFMQRNTGAEYAEYKAELKSVLQARGESYANMVMDKLRSSTRGLTRAEAEAEVLADASEMMLRDTAAMQALAQRSPGLVGKIKKFLSDFVRRIKAGFQGLTATSIEAQAVMEAEKYVGKLQELWDDALTKAAGNVAGNVKAKVTVKAVEEAGEQVAGVQIAEANDSAAIDYSWRTWETSEYVTRKNETAKELAKKIGVTQVQAKKWIDDVTSISAMIVERKDILDYLPSRFVSSFKSNPEYGGSIDMSTICAKRRLATGTLDAIQNMLGDEAMNRDDFLRIREMMREKGYEVACGLCFVESSRANLSKYVKQFVDQYNMTAAQKVTMPEFNTVEGLEQTRENNPVAFKAFEKFMGKLAQRKPKLFEKRTEYDGEILKRFQNEANIEAKNRFGGLRINSFSDFEIPHLIDMMQVIMDMSNVGLAGQAYTKVPDFAWALGDTGLKINLSMIAKGVDASGKLIFDEVEGMKRADAEALRNRYSKNVGTIVVCFNDEQILAAMADDFVDFIIPFHRSQWTKKDYARLGLPEGTKDYTLQQNEKQGRKRVAENFMPNDYWNFNQSGRQNAENYLKKCAADGRTPKFAKFLVNNGDGTYSLKDDGSTDGYWKLLIDFKMYDNDGKGSRQLPVRPAFNMDEARRMLENYEGGHETFPVAQDVVEEFVKEFRSRKGVAAKAGEQVKLAVGNVAFSDRKRTAPTMRRTLTSIIATDDMTDTEKFLLEIYKKYAAELQELQGKMAEQQEIIDTEGTTADELTKAKNRLQILRSQAKRAEKKLLDAEKSEGFAKLMQTSRDFVRRFMTSGSYTELARNVEAELADVRKQLKEITSDLSSLNEEQQMQMVRQIFDPRQLDKAARDIKRAYNSKMTLKEIGNRLALMYASLYSGDVNSGEQYHDQLQMLASDVLRSGTRHTTDTLEVLKEYIGSIRVTDVQKQELLNKGISMKEFRRVVNPVVKIADGKTASELMNHIMQDEGGNPVAALFEGYMGEGDSILRLYELIAQEREDAGTIEGLNDEEALIATMVDIMDKASLPAPDGMSAAGILLNAAIESAGITEEMTKRIRQLDTKLEAAKKNANFLKHKAASTDGVAQEVARYYGKLEEQRRLVEIEEATQRIKEQLKDEQGNLMKAWYTEKELQEKNASLKGQITRMVNWMDKRIRKETDRKRIPEGFKPVVEEMVRTFLATNDLLRIFNGKEAAYISKTYADLAKLDGTDIHQLDSMYTENVEELLADLRQDLEAYANVPQFEKRLNKLTIRNQCLEKILDVVQSIWKITQDIDTTLINGQEASISATAASMATELEKRKDFSVKAGAIGKMKKAIDNAARNGNLTPVYFIRRLENETLQVLNDDLGEAESRYGLLKAKSKETLDGILAKYNYYAWKDDKPLTFVTDEGLRTNAEAHTVTLTKGEAMLLWTTWIRERTSTPLLSSTHLEDGGFVLASGVREVNGREKTDSRPHRLSANDMAAIGNYLTAEQKAFADAIVGYLSRDMAELGNETSMQLFGIRKFKEDYYIPMRVQRDSLAQSSSKGAQGNRDTNRIAHMSATKRRVDKAMKPLVIGDFVDVAANHVNQMLLYNTFAIPIENLNKVLNQGVEELDQIAAAKSGDGTNDAKLITVRALLKQKYGADMAEYLERYIADLNGGPQKDPVEKGLWGKGIGLYKRSAVMASASVALQQPMSIIRAMYVVDPKYFAPIVNHKDAVKLRDEYEQLKQYSGVAVLKEQGGFDMTNTRRDASGLVGNMEDSFSLWQRAKLAVGLGEAKGKERWKAAGRQWEDLFSLSAAKADQIAWAYMWRAVKAETAAALPGADTSSEDFLQASARRFNEVMRLTQVYDSTLVKSQNMRSNTTWMKAFTAFMGEPTVTANILMDAERQGTKKLALAIGNTLISTVATAAAAALAKAGRDKDEDETWLEKYLASINSNLYGWSGSLNPLTMLPGFRDLMSLMDGFDIERSDMSLYADIVDEYNKVLQGKYADEPWQGVVNVAGTVSSVLGIPLKNIMRDLNALYTSILGNAKRPSSRMEIASNFWENALPWADESDAAYYGKLYKAYETGNTQEQKDLIEYLGIRGKDEKKIREGVQKVVKENVISGAITTEQAGKIMKDAGIKATDDERYWILQEWEHQRDGGEGDYKKYTAFYNAVETGNDLRKVMQEYTEHGVSKQTLAGNITEYYKPMLIDLYKTNKSAAANLQARLLNAYELLGYDRAKKLKDIQKWLEPQK